MSEPDNDSKSVIEVRMQFEPVGDEEALHQYLSRYDKRSRSAVAKVLLIELYRARNNRIDQIISHES